MSEDTRYIVGWFQLVFVVCTLQIPMYVYFLLPSCINCANFGECHQLCSYLHEHVYSTDPSLSMLTL